MRKKEKAKNRRKYLQATHRNSQPTALRKGTGDTETSFPQENIQMASRPVQEVQQQLKPQRCLTRTMSLARRPRQNSTRGWWRAVKQPLGRLMVGMGNALAIMEIAQQAVEKLTCRNEDFGWHTGLCGNEQSGFLTVNKVKFAQSSVNRWAVLFYKATGLISWIVPNNNNKREVSIDRSNDLCGSFQDHTKWKHNSEMLSRAGAIAQWVKDLLPDLSSIHS